MAVKQIPLPLNNSVQLNSFDENDIDTTEDLMSKKGQKQVNLEYKIQLCMLCENTA